MGEVGVDDRTREAPAQVDLAACHLAQRTEQLARLGALEDAGLDPGVQRVEDLRVARAAD